MKKLIYILLFSISSIASYGQTCVATGTTKAGKLGMCSPSLGAVSDSVVVWNATGERLLKYIPRSSFNELTADELAAIQNANAPNAGNPFATMDDATTKQILENSGSFTSGDYSWYISADGGAIQITNIITGATSTITSDDGISFSDPTGNQSQMSANQIGFAPIAGGSAIVRADNVLNAVIFQLPNKPAGVETPAMLSDLTGFGTGTVTSVTGTNGVTVASGTSTPVIGLGNITPIKVNGITLSGSSTPALAVTGTASVSGANTGDQDLSALELKSNKQNSLVADGTGNKYITVDAVRKLSAFANLEIYPTQAGSSAPTLTIVNNPTAAVLTTAYVDFGQYNIISDLPIFANSYPNDNTEVAEQHAILSQLTGTIRGWYCYRIDDYTVRLECVSDFLTVGSYDNDIFNGKILVAIKLKL